APRKAIPLFARCMVRPSVPPNSAHFVAGGTWEGGTACSRCCPTGWQKVEAMDKEADEPERAGLHLARNLISLRHARTLTQDTLAAAAGLPRSTIANLESGEANPSLAVLVKIASALGVPIDELLAAPRAKVRKWTAKEIGSRQRGRDVAERPLV